MCSIDLADYHGTLFGFSQISSGFTTSTTRLEVLSSEEVVARGVQPHRFEPRRRVRCDDEESDPGDSIMFHFSAWSVIPVNRIGDLLA